MFLEPNLLQLSKLMGSTAEQQFSSLTMDLDWTGFFAWLIAALESLGCCFRGMLGVSVLLEGGPAG